MEVVCTVPLDHNLPDSIDPTQVDILLLDLDDQAERRVDNLYDTLEQWRLPVLFNDHGATRLHLLGDDPKFLRKLKLKLMSLLPQEPDGGNA
ncbi:MAG: hypothetical protein WCC36_06860 [Gammaproteobacteria bacterium]